jgi:hypothetical protein
MAALWHSVKGGGEISRDGAAQPGVYLDCIVAILGKHDNVGTVLGLDI